MARAQVAWVMAATDPRIDAYVAARAPFAQPILKHLRTIVHDACPDVAETIKWGMPFFTYRDRPLANMAGFKAHASFGFWNREALATGQEEGEAMGQFGRLSSLTDLPSDAELAALVQTAMALIDSGAKPQRALRTPKPEAEVPPELAAALADDPTAQAAFTAFAPSHRREYCEWIAEAKRPETRAKRVAETVAWVRDGRQRNWRYQVA